MATKKHKNFEYAGHTGGLDSEGNNFHAFDSFDTPNGFAFVVVGNDRDPGPETSLSQIVIERLKYYLEIEDEVSPTEAVRNALVYVNGYVYTLSKKTPGMQAGELSCLCVLFKEQKIYYSWIGQTCLHLFTGKKLVPLTWEVFEGQEDTASAGPGKLAFMGTEQFLNPGVCGEALVPVDGDMLILGTSGFCLNPEEKRIRKVLSDSMPTHTKVQRLISQTGQNDEEAPMAVMLTAFYNLDQQERSFVAGGAIVPEKETKGDQQSVWTLSNPVVRNGLIVVGLAFVLYMIYDLFLFNPRPARQIAPVEQTEELMPEPGDVADSLTSVPSDQAMATPETPLSPGTTQPATLPSDRTYQVRSGDTWGRIYREFEVCSWFIRNHPPNQGKFDRSDNPVAGTTLLIPVKYSASERLNPNYFQHFTTDLVGGSCENANREFLRRFEESRRAS